MKRRTFIEAAAASLAIPFWPSLAATFAPADTAATRLGKLVRGRIFVPGFEEYERKRHGFAADVDLHPAIVVQPLSAGDVSVIVRFARQNRLPLAVRCGGHSYAGYNSCDGGIIIDLSGLNAIELSADQQTVRVGGGVLSGHIEEATAEIGRAASLGQCPGVGVGGFVLGGGVGPLMSRCGLGCDNLVAAEVVLADGRVVAASERQHTDLFWAIRGGGGNFGVVTRFVLKLHKVSTVLGGYLTYRSSSPSDLLAILRDLSAAAPADQTLIATLAPERDNAFSLSVQVCDAGDVATGEHALAPFRKLPSLVSDTVIVQPYIALEKQVPFEIGAMRRENRGGFFPELSAGVIAELSRAVATAPDRDGDIALIHLHGAVTRLAEDATAFPLRTRGFAHNVAARWSPAGGQARAAAWVRDTAAALQPFGKGAYVNVMGRENEAAVRAAYVGNYPRLVAAKRKYDPTNMFAVNQNIPSA